MTPRTTVRRTAGPVPRATPSCARAKSKKTLSFLEYARAQARHRDPTARDRSRGSRAETDHQEPTMRHPATVPGDEQVHP